MGYIWKCHLHFWSPDRGSNVIIWPLTHEGQGYPVAGAVCLYVCVYVCAYVWVRVCRVRLPFWCTKQNPWCPWQQIVEQCVGKCHFLSASQWEPGVLIVAIKLLENYKRPQQWDGTKCEGLTMCTATHNTHTHSLSRSQTALSYLVTTVNHPDIGQGEGGVQRSVGKHFATSPVPLPQWNVGEVRGWEQLSEGTQTHQMQQRLDGRMGVV